MIRLSQSKVRKLGLSSLAKAKRVKLPPPSLNGTHAVKQVSLELGTPPSDNRHYRRGSGGQVYLTKSAKAFRESVKAEALGKGHVVGKVSVTVWVAANNFDIQNLIKETCDAIQNAGVVNNDRQIHKFLIQRDESRKDGIGVLVEGDYPC